MAGSPDCVWQPTAAAPRTCRSRRDGQHAPRRCVTPRPRRVEAAAVGARGRSGWPPSKRARRRSCTSPPSAPIGPRPARRSTAAARARRRR
eukprot:5576391-Prymnesium_polylepis.1